MRLSLLQGAAAFAVGGSILAVSVPTFRQHFRASHFVEPVDGLDRLAQAALAHAQTHGQLPPRGPLTPAVVPRAERVVDAPGTWEASPWSDLGFRPTPDGVPHAYAFALEPQGESFVAQARGDLDGDGVLSLFEVRGHTTGGEGPRVEPGLYVEAPLE